MRYPTVADATAAGMFLAGGFAPGSGAHYIAISGISGSGPIDVDEGELLHLRGHEPRLADRRLDVLLERERRGLRRSQRPLAPAQQRVHQLERPERRSRGAVPRRRRRDRQAVRGAGGRLMPITGYMVHAWVVPGWESPQGVFSHENLNLRCADGTLRHRQGRVLPGDLTPHEPAPTPWALPDPADAPPGEEIVGVGADLEPATLLAAYRGGLFPMRLGAAGPVAWWSPDPRGIIPLDGLVVHRSTRRACRRHRVTVDAAFEDVMRGCADPARPARVDRRGVRRRLHASPRARLGAQRGGLVARRPTATSSSAGSTASPSAGCSPGSRCSTERATPRRLRWSRPSSACGAAEACSSTCSGAPRTSPHSVRSAVPRDEYLGLLADAVARPQLTVAD